MINEERFLCECVWGKERKKEGTKREKGRKKKMKKERKRDGKKMLEIRDCFEST